MPKVYIVLMIWNGLVYIQCEILWSHAFGQAFYHLK